MPDHTCATDGGDPRGAADGDPREAADCGYFAPLAPARHMWLTTFNRDGMPVSASVRGMVDGERAYFCARNGSGTVKRLQHTDAVQVTPCGVLGFCTYGPPIDAIALPLSGEVASLVTAKLNRRYPVRCRFLMRLLRRQALYYELLADDAVDGQSRNPEFSGAWSVEPGSGVVSIRLNPTARSVDFQRSGVSTGRAGSPPRAAG